jgi:glycosyltransferase involved in cell wall biosynthesis
VYWEGGWQRGELELEKTLQLAKHYGVAEKLAFESPISFEALKVEYRNSDVFVLPTYMEGVPRVILEAQAAGLPVVTTTVGGIPGAVKDGEDAILVPPGDPQAIANAILRIINDEELRKRMIAMGLESAWNHTLDAETKTMIERLNNSGFFD